MIIQTNGRGTLYARAWPQRRKRPLHPTTIEQITKFTAVQHVAKRVAPDIAVAARSVTKGTALMPRDIITKALYGNLLAIHSPGERTMIPMSTAQQISALLDLLANQPGDMLQRGADLWGPSQGGTGGSAWHWWKGYNAIATDTDFTGAATMGNIWDQYEDAQISETMARWSVINGETYVMRVARLSGTNVIQEIVSSDPVAVSDAIVYPRRFRLLATLIAGQRYALLLSRTSGADNSECRAYRNSGSGPLWPGRHIGWTRPAKIAPAIGDTLTIVNANDAAPFGMNYLPV